MQAESAASQTALMVCAYRARESRAARPLFVDPWAEALAGADGEALAARLEAQFPPMGLWLALRVAYLDRLVGLAVDRLSVRQVVILGAGYDTRAARLPRSGTTYFEVDHPATQAAKRARLAALPGYPVDAARYVACDFERQDPITQLVDRGFDVREPALVIWEGVVPYLTEAAVRATATRLAAGLDPRSVVAFDFVGKKLVEGSSANTADHATRQYVGELGEPLRFGANDILPLCADAGFRWVRSLDFNQLALELCGDYVRDRQFRFQHIALCSRTTPAIGWP
ncbi:MAG: class I SAM-dependent methyltransferase [Deltaproteobacteria bacterium]|nr:class I SAM-dependent methyltransferase [Deltaproteobacteria bacterium]